MITKSCDLLRYAPFPAILFYAVMSRFLWVIDRNRWSYGWSPGC